MLLSAIMVYTGVAHFRNPEPFIGDRAGLAAGAQGTWC